MAKEHNSKKTYDLNNFPEAVENRVMLEEMARTPQAQRSGAGGSEIFRGTGKQHLICKTHRSRWRTGP